MCCTPFLFRNKEGAPRGEKEVHPFTSVEIQNVTLTRGVRGERAPERDGENEKSQSVAKET